MRTPLRVGVLPGDNLSLDHARAHELVRTRLPPLRRYAFPQQRPTLESRPAQRVSVTFRDLHHAAQATS
jgi:hypothetical protein